VSAAPPEERTYFHEGSVAITSTRAIIGSKTYAMANVSSVNRIVEPWPRPKLILCALLAGGCAFAFDHAWWLWAITVGLLVAGILGKDRHVPVITGAGGETRALETRDGKFFDGAASAMELAIVNPG
jgi:hypothetical protein